MVRNEWIKASLENTVKGDFYYIPCENTPLLVRNESFNPNLVAPSRIQMVQDIPTFNSGVALVPLDKYSALLQLADAVVESESMKEEIATLRSDLRELREEFRQLKRNSGRPPRYYVQEGNNATRLPGG